jgi:hypothetical protein
LSLSLSVTSTAGEVDENLELGDPGVGGKRGDCDDDAFFIAFTSFRHSDSVISSMVGKGRVDDRYRRAEDCGARLEFQSRFFLVPTAIPRRRICTRRNANVAVIDLMASNITLSLFRIVLID